MARTAAPKLALKRGALIAAANWQVVAVQFIADAIFTALLAVPVAGGAMLVLLTSGLAPGDVIRQGVRRAVPAVAAALLAQPIALAAFLAAVLLVLLGGSLLLAFIKGGTISVLVASEREAGPVELPPLRAAAVRRANRFTLERATTGAQRLFGRFAWLGGVLFVAYTAVLATALGTLVSVGSPDSAWDAARIAGLTAAVASTITVINLLYLLTQIAITVDDCDVRTAMARIAHLLYAQPFALGVRLREHVVVARARRRRVAAGHGGARADRVRAVCRPGRASAPGGRLGGAQLRVPVPRPDGPGRLRADLPAIAGARHRRDHRLRRRRFDDRRPRQAPRAAPAPAPRAARTPAGALRPRPP